MNIYPKQIYNINDTYYKKYTNVILTSYFTSKIDPLRNKFVKSNDYEYIKPWYESMNKNKLHGIIFHDGLSDFFINQYQTEKIIFKKCIIGNYSLNDERFIIYLMYLKHNKYINVFMTDVRDVIVNSNDPFKIIDKENKLYVGKDENLIGTNEWLKDKIKNLMKLTDITHLSNDEKDIFTQQFYTMPLYNAGIIGGSYNTIINLLTYMVDIFKKFNNSENNNMITLNYVIYKHFKINNIQNKDYDVDKLCSNYLYSGYPLNNKFMALRVIDDKWYTNVYTDCLFIHK